MNRLVFGSSEANDLLARETGKRFDLADVDPLSHRHNLSLDAPNEGDDSERHCTVCGCHMEWVDCWQCGGDGYIEVYEDDPMWYEPDDTEKCTECNGIGGYWECSSLPHPDTASESE